MSGEWKTELKAYHDLRTGNTVVLANVELTIDTLDVIQTPHLEAAIQQVNLSAHLGPGHAMYVLGQAVVAAGGK